MGIWIIFSFGLVVLSVVGIILSIAFLKNRKPAMSIAAAVVGAVSGAKAVSMFFMFGFITDILFVVYAIIIVFLNYKKCTANADETSESENSTNEN